jgi:hypothetical protein
MLSNSGSVFFQACALLYPMQNKGMFPQPGIYSSVEQMYSRMMRPFPILLFQFALIDRWMPVLVSFELY